MKKKKVYFAPKKNVVDPKKEKEKVGEINKALIELRKSYIRITANNQKLENKINHFKKLFNSKVQDKDKSNFISYHLFSDKINDK